MKKHGLGALVAVICALGSFACDRVGEAEGPVVSESSALALGAGKVFEVEAAPATFPSNEPQPGKVACGSLRCVVFYAQVVEGNPIVVGTRVTKSGAVVDLPRIELGPSGTSVLAVGARDDQFFVAWRGLSSLPGFEYPPHLTGVDGATGALTDLTSKLPQGTYLEQLVVTPTRTVLTYDENSTYKFALFDTNFNAVGSPFAPGVTGVVNPSVIVPSDGQFLLAWSGSAQRVNSVTGALLDATPINFSRYKLGEPSAVFVNGNYQLAWATGNNLYGSRILASDGTVLDADDTFNQTTGAKLLCAACSQSLLNLRVSALGTDALATWTGSDYQGTVTHLFAARISSATGLRTDAKTNAPELSSATSTGQEEIALNGASGLLINKNQVRSVSVTSSPLALTFGAESPLAVQSTPRAMPASASNGTGFLAVWVADGHIRGTRIDVSTGAYLNDPALDFGAGSLPAVVAVGSDYLVAWLDSAFKIQRRFVRANGTLDARLENPIAAKQDYETTTPTVKGIKLTYNGKYVLLSWLYGSGYMQGRVVRLTSLGAAVEPTFVTIANLVQSEYYAVLADTTPAEAMRTFLIVDAEGANSLSIHRFRSETGALIPDVTPISGARLARGAMNPQHLAIEYRQNNEDEVAQFLDPVDGSLLGTPATVLPYSSNAFGALFWWDGVSFVLAGDSALQLFGRRFNASLSSLDAAVPGPGTLLASVHDVTLDLAVSADGKGHSLLLFRDFSVSHLGFAVHGALVSNDGMPAPVGSAGGGAGGGAGAGVTAGGSAITGGVAGAGVNIGGAAGATPSAGGANTEGGAAGADPESVAGASALGGSGTAHAGSSSGGASAAAGNANATSGGSPSSAGATDAPPPSSYGSNGSSGCGCRVSGDMSTRRSPLGLLAALGLLSLHRRRSRRRPSGPPDPRDAQG